jgi:hypothetical protein
MAQDGKSFIGLVCIILAMAVPGAVTWLFFVGAPGSQSTQIFYSLSKIFMLIFPIGVVKLVWGFNRATLKPKLGSILQGVGLGSAMAAIILAAYFFLFAPLNLFSETPELLQSKMREFGVVDLKTYMMLAAFICIVNSTLEEYYWRWFIFGKLRHYVRPGLAMVVGAAAFVIHHQVVIGHYLPEAYYFTFALLFSCSVGVAGFFWAWIYHRTDDLWAPWISHLIADVAIMVIGYTLIF